MPFAFELDILGASAKFGNASLGEESSATVSIAECQEG
jgi:hypothetical protein